MTQCTAACKPSSQLWLRANSRNLRVYNFVILIKLRKSDARKIQVLQRICHALPSIAVQCVLLLLYDCTFVSLFMAMAARL